MDATAVKSGNGGDGRKTRLLSLDDLDGRTRARRRAEDLRESVLSERGGEEHMDALKLAHASTWALLTVMIEDQGARFLLGEPIEPTVIPTLVNARKREADAIGAPEPRDVTNDYLVSNYGKAPETASVATPAAVEGA